jgi:hypothetical protein
MYQIAVIYVTTYSKWPAISIPRPSKIAPHTIWQPCWVSKLNTAATMSTPQYQKRILERLKLHFLLSLIFLLLHRVGKLRQEQAFALGLSDAM